MGKKYKVLITNPAPANCRCDNPAIHKDFRVPEEWGEGFYAPTYGETPWTLQVSRVKESAIQEQIARGIPIEQRRTPDFPWARDLVYQIVFKNGYSVGFMFGLGEPEGADIIVYNGSEVEMAEEGVTADELAEILQASASIEGDRAPSREPGFYTTHDNPRQGFMFVFENGYVGGAFWTEMAEAGNPGESYSDTAELNLINPDGDFINIAGDRAANNRSPERMAQAFYWASSLGDPREGRAPGQVEQSIYPQRFYEAPLLPGTEARRRSEMASRSFRYDGTPRDASDSDVSYSGGWPAGGYDPEESLARAIEIAGESPAQEFDPDDPFGIRRRARSMYSQLGVKSREVGYGRGSLKSQIAEAQDLYVRRKNDAESELGETLAELEERRISIPRRRQMGDPMRAIEEQDIEDDIDDAHETFKESLEDAERALYARFDRLREEFRNTPDLERLLSSQSNPVQRAVNRRRYR